MKIRIIILSALAIAFVLIHQNCAPLQFSASQVTQNSQQALSCNPSTQPQVQTEVSCPDGTSGALQNFEVLCAGESWIQTAKGDLDYSACNLCEAASRPAMEDSQACLAPNGGLNLAVQKYNVSCNAQGQWVRVPSGSVDYSKCPAVCAESLKPPLTQSRACLAPYASQNLAIQRYNVTCESNGTWSSVSNSGVDYSACPVDKVCDPSKEPAKIENVSCSSDGSLLAKQNYTVTCNKVTGSWERVVSGGVDESLCPKACTAVKPSANRDCSSEIAGTSGTIFNFYQVSCNSTTGSWNQNPNTSGASYSCTCDDSNYTFSTTTKTCQPKATTDVIWPDCPNAINSDSTTWKCEVYNFTNDAGRIPSQYFTSNYTFTSYMSVLPSDPNSALPSQVGGGVVTMSGSQLSMLVLIRGYTLINNPINKNVYAVFEIKDSAGNISNRYWRKVHVDACPSGQVLSGTSCVSSQPAGPCTAPPSVNLDCTLSQSVNNGSTYQCPTSAASLPYYYNTAVGPTVLGQATCPVYTCNGGTSWSGPTAHNNCFVPEATSSGAKCNSAYHNSGSTDTFAIANNGCSQGTHQWVSWGIGNTPNKYAWTCTDRSTGTMVRCKTQ